MSKRISKKPTLTYNSIANQAKTNPNGLTVAEWNFIVNVLKQQTNYNTKQIEDLHRFLIDGYDSNTSGDVLLDINTEELPNEGIVPRIVTMVNDIIGTMATSEELTRAVLAHNSSNTAHGIHLVKQDVHDINEFLTTDVKNQIMELVRFMHDIAPNILKSKLDNIVLEHDNSNTAHGINIVKQDINTLKDDKADKLTVNTDLASKAPLTHTTDSAAHSDIRSKVDIAIAIAEGKSRGRVFDTYEHLQDWLTTGANELVIGDNLYIDDHGVPDYWWNGFMLKELETEKVDLTDYYKKSFVYNKNESDALFAKIEDLFSKDYSDLINKPALFSGDYNDLINLPALFSKDYNDLLSKPALFSGDYNDLINLPDAATMGGVINLGAQPTKDTGLSLCVNPGLYTFTVAGISYLIEVNLNNETPEQKWIEIFTGSTIAYSRVWYGEEYGWHSFPPQILSLSDAAYWDSQVWYMTDSVVRGSNNKIYYSKTLSNKGNDPVDDSTFAYWGEVDYENVQADWLEADPNKESFIKNKITKVSQLTNDSEFITVEDIPDVDLTDYYNKTEVDTKLIHNHDTLYEPKNVNIQEHIGTTTGNPHGVKFADLSDKPTTMTPTAHTHTKVDITDLAAATQSVMGLMSSTDKTNLDTLVALLDSPDEPTVVNTINEILTIFNNYPEGADLVTALGDKVDKIAGKGLTKNELTDALKANYNAAYTHSTSAHAPSGAQANIIETVKVNGAALPVTSKTVDITIPETDLSNYYNKSEVETCVSNAILGLLGGSY